MRKSTLGLKGDSETVSVPAVYGIPVGLLSRDEAEKARKLVQLQAQIKNKLASGILGNIYIPKTVERPKPLILDEHGRTVDATGKEVQLTTVAPTLKANLRVRKKTEAKSLQKRAAEAAASHADLESKHFDDRIEQKPATRLKRQLTFNEPGNSLVNSYLIFSKFQFKPLI